MYYFHQLKVTLIEKILLQVERSVETPKSSWILRISTDDVGEVFDSSAQVLFAAVSVIELSQSEEIIIVVWDEQDNFFITEQCSQVLRTLRIEVSQFKPSLKVIRIIL
jgi:hypothetical protein